MGKSGFQRANREKVSDFEKNFIPLNTMMERAGMSEMDIYHQTRDIFRYFKLPFDTETPEK